MNKNSRIFYLYDISNDKMTKLKDMIYGHSYHSMFSENDNIYVISGFKSKKTEKYSIKSNNWTSMPDLNTSRSLPSCSVYLDKLYIFGGYDDTKMKTVTLIERIDFKSTPNCWEQLDIKLDDNFPFYTGIISQDDRNLFIGGKISKDSDPCNSVWSYHFKENKSEITNILLVNKDEFDGKNFLLIGQNKYGQFSSIYQNCFIIFENESFSKEIYI